MKYNVAELISTMLNEVGLKDIIDEDLSNHSTISLNMKDDIPAINIRSEGDDVWVWARLCDFNLSTLTYCSANLFPVMLNYYEEYFYCGQPCLYSIDGNLELRAQIKDKYLESPDHFMNVLDKYLTIMQEYRAILI